MHSFALVLLALPTALFASAVRVQRRECDSIPSEADPQVLTEVYQIAASRNVSDKVMLATYETAWIESHANNLPCGDKDSLGVFQQRPSQGWGTRDQILNITYSTNKFLDGAIPAYTAFPRYSAGKIAQSVQYSEFPTRYDAAAGTALALIARAQLDLGLPQLPPLPGVEDALLRLAPGTLDATCGDVQAVNAGDTCTMLRKAHDTTLAQLRFWNPSINAACTNLQIGRAYCTNSQVVVPPKNGVPSSGTDKKSCTSYSAAVKKGETCTKLAKTAGVGRSRFIQLNKSINSGCTNLQIGKSYCTTSLSL